MLKTMSNTPLLIQNLNTELRELHKNNDWKQIQRVVLSVVKLLDREVTISNNSLFNLFTDSDGKIRANASWFFEDTTLADRKATYKVNPDNSINLDFKLYGLNKPSKRTISWVQALTPNFEDEPFNSKFSIGIDFIVPKSLDKVIVVLSNNYVVRTLELKGELTVTYQEIFDKWLKIQDFSNKKEVHNILWESFDLQPLNKKFYAGISERFLELRQHLINNKILDEKHSSMFSNRLIGRVIFCWFLDKKEILNPENKYFDSKSYSNSTEYYKERLEKLFFEILNTPIEDRKYPDKLTPFLNGGLFEPRENDLYQDSKLNFPVNFFDSLFSFLSGYNFTTDESTSQFQQVAIDPEMLGRIFENLLAEINETTGEQARKAKGAFYTHREIVEYMCREALFSYLKREIPTDEYRDQRLYQLIEAPDKDFQDQDHNWRRDWKPYKENILKALDNLKILDPACGSGAFPIGMMQLLVKVYERLETRFDPYKIKLQVIEQNIFGVDIEPMAVEITRLRAWLSIVVDEDSDSQKIKPLPNLDFKFIAANTLINLDQGKSETFSMFEDSNLDEKLREIRESYFKTENLEKKKQLRDKLTMLVERVPLKESTRSQQLKTYRPFDNENSCAFFDPEFMFGVEKFDIIIGNPPYLESRSKSFTKEMKEEIQKSVKQRWEKDSKYIQSGSDLLIYFYERAIDLINENGFIIYIVQNSWLDTDYGKNFQRFLIRHTNVKQIIDSDMKQFEGPNVNTIITVFEGNTSNPNNNISFARFVSKDGSNSKLDSFNNLTYKNLRNIAYSDETLSLNKWGIFMSASNELLTILAVMRKKAKTLQEIGFSIGQGLNLTKDHFVKIDENYKQKLDTDKLIPIMTNDDGAPFELNKTEKYLTDFNTKKTTKKPPVLILPRGINRHFCARNMCGAFTASYVDIYSPTNSIDEETTLNLWCFLNSSLAWLIRENMGRKNLGGGMLKAEATDLKNLPIYFDFKEKEKIINIYNSLSNRHALPIADELQTPEHIAIDLLVFDFLELNRGEQKKIIDDLLSIVKRRNLKSKSSI